MADQCVPRRSDSVRKFCTIPILCTWIIPGRVIGPCAVIVPVTSRQVFGRNDQAGTPGDRPLPGVMMQTTPAGAMIELPPPDTKRWVARRKAAVVEAVRMGQISLLGSVPPLQPVG